MATVTLRPAGAGNQTSYTPHGSANNYSCVNESTADNDSTYNDLGVIGAFRELYTIDSNSIGATDTINNITIYLVARMVTTGRLRSVDLSASIRENATSTNSNSQALSTTGYVTKSYTWTTKPSNGTAFTKTDIDNLQIGCLIAQSNASNCRITQVYVVVDYTPSGGGGSVSQKIIMPRQAIKRASNY